MPSRPKLRPPTHILRRPTLGLTLSDREFEGILYMQAIEWGNRLDPDWYDPNDGKIFAVNNSFDPAGETLLDLKYLVQRRNWSSSPKMV